MAVVTGLRPTRGGVAVDLDGVTWRTFAVAVVVVVLAGAFVTPFFDAVCARTSMPKTKRKVGTDIALNNFAITISFL